MAALLVAMSVMAVVLSVALPVWNTYAKREREAELVFRGEQYARAIGLFQRKYANTLPPNLDVLVNERFLRKKYTDPITGGEFQLLSGATGQAGTGAMPGAGAGAQSRTGGPGTSTTTGAGRTGFSTGQTGGGQTGPGRTGSFGGAAAGGIMGVVSKSTDKSLRLYFGRGAYNEWTFVAVQRETQAGGPPGAQAPGATGPGAMRPGGGPRVQPGARPGGAGTLPSLPPPPFGTRRSNQ
jgi:type II secretory pathway pseudopilin PulG